MDISILIRLQAQEAQQMLKKRLGQLKSRGTQIACVTCALSENPRYHEDEVSVGSATIAEVLCKPILMDALKGEVVLVARPRKIRERVSSTAPLISSDITSKQQHAVAFLVDGDSNKLPIFAKTRPKSAVALSSKTSNNQKDCPSDKMKVGDDQGFHSIPRSSSDAVVGKYSKQLIVPPASARNIAPEQRVVPQVLLFYTSLNDHYRRWMDIHNIRTYTSYCVTI